MQNEREPAGFDREGQVTEQSVERFYRFKESLRVVGDGPVVADLCESAGINVEKRAEIKNTALFRKQVLEQYLSLYFPRSLSATERSEKIGRHVERLRDFFQQEDARSILWVGGSYGTGRAHGAQSDLDLFLGLPKLSNVAERNAEMQVFRNLETIDFVIAQNIASTEDIVPVLETGKGLARLSGMTKDGIEIDFHGVGVKDLEAMDKLSPGFVERIRKVEPYKEDRTSFIGSKKELPKPGDKLFNYKEEDGEMFKGFYPDGFSALGELVYDPDGTGIVIQDALWRAIIKGFLFHNQAYEKRYDTGKIVVNRTKAAFSDFLKTLYYQNPRDYSKEKLRFLEEKYQRTLNEIVERHHWIIDD